LILSMSAVWQTKSPPGPRRPMVHRSPEANPGGSRQSAETAGHQEKGETVREDLAGRRCP
jgi:hypothetical protein